MHTYIHTYILIHFSLGGGGRVGAEETGYICIYIYIYIYIYIFGVRYRQKKLFHFLSSKKKRKKVMKKGHTSRRIEPVSSV